VWQKVLFLAGAFPFYQYVVLCRGHALAMLLLFGVAAAYKDRFTWPLPLCGLLLLLANVNAYALILAVAVVISILVEALMVRPALNRSTIIRGAWGFALTHRNDWRCHVDDPRFHDRGDLDPESERVRCFASGSECLRRPGSLYAFLAGGHAWLANAGFWVVTATLLSTLASLGVVGGCRGVQFLLITCLPVRFHAAGLLYVFFVTLAWVASTSPDAPQLAGRFATLRRIVPRARRSFSWCCSSRRFQPASPSSRDLAAALSSSESLGRYLTASPELREAIVIPEPAVMVEALPYYAPNRIYLPREGKDLIKVSFTTASKPKLSLDELLSTAERLKGGNRAARRLGHSAPT
jgi:hypothetical protein